MRRLQLLTLVCASLAYPAATRAQGSATAARSCAGAAWHAPVNAVVMLGGARFCGRDVLHDSTLWAWDGARWSALARAPHGLEDLLLVSDDDALLIYGGRSAAGATSDLYTWRDGAWRRRAGNAPPVREHAAGALQRSPHRLVIFGGGSVRGMAEPQTWVLEDTVWRALAASGPAARVGHTMIGAGSDVYLYGGFAQAGSFRDLWVLRGDVWEQLDDAGPSHTEGMALFARGDTLHLVGPGLIEDPIGAPLQVWRWHDGAWNLLATDGPPNLVAQQLVWDAARRRLVLWGGATLAGEPRRDVWEFDGTRWVRIEPR